MGNSDSCFSEDECSICRRENQQKACTNPYIWFYLDVYKELAPLTVKEIGIEAGRRWRTMTKEQKEPYIRRAKEKSQTVHYLESKNPNKTHRIKSCRTRIKKRKQGKGIKKQTSNSKIRVKLSRQKH